MNHQKTINRQRARRHFRVRKRVQGTPERPRLSVFRSGKHIYAQVIDDLAGRTLASASTMDKQLRSKDIKAYNTEAAKAIGAAIAQRALAAGVQQVCFDRRYYRYHGRVAALADAARAAGLSF